MLPQGSDIPHSKIGLPPSKRTVVVTATLRKKINVGSPKELKRTEWKDPIPNKYYNEKLQIILIYLIYVNIFSIF